MQQQLMTRVERRAPVVGRGRSVRAPRRIVSIRDRFSSRLGVSCGRMQRERECGARTRTRAQMERGRVLAPDALVGGERAPVLTRVRDAHETDRIEIREDLRSDLQHTPSIHVCVCVLVNLFVLVLIAHRTRSRNCWAVEEPVATSSLKD